MPARMMKNWKRSSTIPTRQTTASTMRALQLARHQEGVRRGIGGAHLEPRGALDEQRLPVHLLLRPPDRVGAGQFRAHLEPQGGLQPADSCGVARVCHRHDDLVAGAPDWHRPQAEREVDRQAPRQGGVQPVAIEVDHGHPPLLAKALPDGALVGITARHQHLPDGGLLGALVAQRQGQGSPPQVAVANQDLADLVARGRSRWGTGWLADNPQLARRPAPRGRRVNPGGAGAGARPPLLSPALDRTLSSRAITGPPWNPRPVRLGAGPV